MATNTNANIGFEKQIWDAACVLRGNMDASEYKSVVLGLIFLKYISDRFEAKYNALVEEGDGFEEDKDEYTAENIFFVPENARWKVIAAAAHTPEIGAVIAQCGGAKEEANKIVLGGPMMGQCAFDLQTPVTKGVSGTLLFRDNETEKPLGNCVRCGGCVNVCPVGLMPLTLYALSRKGLYERARDAQHLMDCIECGACAYQCPARLPLVQYIRVAKGALRRAQARA